MKNFAFLLKKAGIVVVLINSYAYDFSSFSGKQLKGKEISFNSNYYWKGLPIGILTGFQKTIWEPALTTRAILTVDQEGRASIVDSKHRIKDPMLESQVGPWLLRDGTIIKDKQGFPNSTLRTTKRLAVGTTSAGKIVICFTEHTPIFDIGGILKSYGCTDAMGLDSGSSTSLWIDKEFWGSRPGSIPFGVYLVLKNKPVKAMIGPP